VSANLVWAVWILLFAIFETAALISRKTEDTLSERTRAWFDVHARTGRWIFGVGWVVFSVWFFIHILWG
jgi:hypothetical protein